MNKRTCLILTLLTILTSSAPAAAESFYIGADIGLSLIDDAVETEQTISTAPGILPGTISLDGLPFDSNETAWGVLIGWSANEWLAIEIGYTDLGNTGRDSLIGFAGPVLIAPSPGMPANPFPIPPSVAAFSVISPYTLDDAAALDIEEWSLSAKFRKRLSANLSANWTVGLTSSRFTAEGSLNFNQIISLVPLVTNPVSIPYASPGDDTGYILGFGFGWDFNERFSTEIEYKKHDTGVLDIETVTLRLLIRL